MPFPLSATSTAIPGSPMRLRPEDLDQLFKRVRKGDYIAFERIFENSYQMLCLYSKRYVESRQLAEEIVDDVFFNLWRNRMKIRIRSSFHAYLVASVRNKSLDCLRTLKHERRRSLLEHAESVPCQQSIASEAMILDELHQRIHAAVNILPRQCRIIFQMSREEDLKYKDIASKLNISIKTVDTQIGRALRHIRKVIAA